MVANRTKKVKNTRHVHVLIMIGWYLLSWKRHSTKQKSYQIFYICLNTNFYLFSILIESHHDYGSY